MRVLISLTTLIILISVAWNSPILLPLKWLVVFFYESSQAFATLLTGGTVQSLQIVPEQGGQVVSQGGNHFCNVNYRLFGGFAVWVAVNHHHIMVFLYVV